MSGRLREAVGDLIDREHARWGESPTAVLDETHAESVGYVEQIRTRHAQVVAEVARWEPAPCPAEWKAGAR